MAKANAKHLNHLYRQPVGVEMMPLPEVYPHNPMSWAYFAYKLVSYLFYSPIPDPIGVEVDQGVFKVDTSTGIQLWRSGFYGKGSLSRSEPAWYKNRQSTGLESVTRQRRQERQVFKDHRAELQKLEISHRKNELNEAQFAELERLREVVDDLRNREVEFKKEDRDDIDEDVEDLEYLQLSAVEAVYLKELGVINITNDGVSQSVDDLRDMTHMSRDSKQMLDYIVYRYFRSLGWCVRSGIKFGTEFLLYKRGPVFGHAEFCVKVMSDRPHSWEEMSTVARVVGTVNKTLVLVFVEPPTEGIQVSDYTVKPVVYRRWNPSRTRD